MRFLFIGLAAGVTSGLLGVGGGLVIVPLLVFLGRFDQHEAHATSLVAIIPIAAAGAFVFALDGELDTAIGLPLALGSLAGAPLGARVMAATSESRLKVAFGVVNLLIALLMVLS